MKDNSAKGNLDNSGTAQEVSERKNISKWPTGHSYDILAKNIATFSPCPRDLPEVELKSFGLTSLAGEISRQSSISLSCVY